MRIAVPTAGRGGMGEQVAGHFGMAPTYTIVDTETGEVEVVDNTSHHMGGTVHPPVVVANAGADAILCGNLGGHAIELFDKYGIEVYVGASGTVQDAIGAWERGQLTGPSPDHECGHDCDHDHHH